MFVRSLHFLLFFTRRSDREERRREIGGTAEIDAGERRSGDAARPNGERKTERQI
jgi:hypothetical protein